jgi:hypothetical protein
MYNGGPKCRAVAISPQWKNRNYWLRTSGLGSGHFVSNDRPKPGFRPAAPPE